MARKTFLLALFSLGLILRLALTFLAGNALRAPWSGGGDGTGYVLLSQNIANGKGYTFGGMPTAFRAPMYPLVLAVARIIAPSKYLLLVRVLQLLSFLVAAWLCSKAADRLWGRDGAYITLACLALSPTLVFLNSEILTESFAVLLTSYFLFAVVFADRDSSRASVNLGVSSGLAMLVRFNAMVLPFIAAFRLWQVFKGRRLLAHLATLALLLGLLLSPWLLRNWFAFGGKPVYSTLSGLGLVFGVYSPQGRADPMEHYYLRHTLGWKQSDIESNEPSRRQYGSEIDLNKQAWRVGLQGYRALGLGVFPLLVRKLGYFWLSTDQLFFVERVPLKLRIFRQAGVLVYWVLLAFAALGFVRLRQLHPALARTFLLYAALCTLLYLPFAMNTRLRSSSIEPLLCILAGGLAVRPRNALPSVMQSAHSLEGADLHPHSAAAGRMPT